MVTASRPPQITGYLYPWDVLDDPKTASRITATGVDRVSLAAAYHSVRAATPRHPKRRIVDASTAALYVPVRSVWNDRPLAPRDAAEWTGTDTSFTSAAAELQGTGLPVDAWTVLTHSTALGGRNPDLCVRNAFGETYRYALCPSQPKVREYAATLVAEVLSLGKPDGLVLEAIGPLGFGHQNQHEKTDGAEYSPWVQALLSLCFCDACLSAYEASGLPGTEYQSQVRDLILGANIPYETPATAPEAQALLPLLEVRWDAAAHLLDDCLTVIKGAETTPHLSLHASPDPWATGPFVSADALRRSTLWPHMAEVSAVVPCWGNSDQGVAAVKMLRQAAPTARVGSYVTALADQGHDRGAMSREWGRLLAAGANDLHVYHLGLASTRRLEAIGAAVSAIRG